MGHCAHRTRGGIRPRLHMVASNGRPVARGCFGGSSRLSLAAVFRALLKTIEMPLRALANVVEAYRGGDYTIRGNRHAGPGALGELVAEINSLGGTLHEQRLRAIEATALLDKLVARIGLAVLAFDSERQMKLCNPAAAQLLD